MDELTSRKQSTTGNSNRGAATLSRSANAVRESIDRNTKLAEHRTAFASERTYAAWMRTALAALVSGLGIRGILAGVLPFWLCIWSASVLIVFSIFCLLAAVWREMRSRVFVPHSDIERVPTIVLLFVNGVLASIAIAALIGVWML